MVAYRSQFSAPHLWLWKSSLLFIFLLVLGCSKKEDSPQDIFYIDSVINTDIKSIVKTETAYILSGGFAWTDGFIAKLDTSNWKSEIIYESNVAFEKLRCKDSLCIAVGVNGIYAEIINGYPQLHDHRMGQVTRDVLIHNNEATIIGGKSYRHGYIGVINEFKEYRELLLLTEN